jgi:hypothetical protein
MDQRVILEYILNDVDFEDMKSDWFLIGFRWQAVVLGPWIMLQDRSEIYGRTPECNGRERSGRRTVGE